MEKGHTPNKPHSHIVSAPTLMASSATQHGLLFFTLSFSSLAFLWGIAWGASEFSATNHQEDLPCHEKREQLNRGGNADVGRQEGALTELAF